MGWEAKLAWPVEHEVGFTCLARGRAQGDPIAPDATPGQPGSGAPSRGPKKNNPQRGAELRTSELPVGAVPSPRPGAGCYASLHRPLPTPGFARRLLGRRAASRGPGSEQPYKGLLAGRRQAAVGSSARGLVGGDPPHSWYPSVSRGVVRRPPTVPARAVARPGAGGNPGGSSARGGAKPRSGRAQGVS